MRVSDVRKVLCISQETVMRDWKFAKNWLMRELSRQGTAGGGPRAADHGRLIG